MTRAERRRTPRSPGAAAPGLVVPATGPGEPEVVVLPGAEAAGRAAAELLAAAARDAVARRGRADVATTGGSTPAAVYRALVSDQLRALVPWDALHLWFGDDRFVARHHTDSNVGPVDAVLFGRDGGPGSPLPHANVHPWPVDATLAAGGSAEDCAAAYAAEMGEAVPTDAEGRPAFDVVLVGIGPDGHVLSIFPGSRAFEAWGWTVAIPPPSHVGPHVARVTCTPAVLDAAGTLIAIAHGAAKADVVARILGGPRDERALPAQRARRAGATFVLDAPAAGGLGAPAAAGSVAR
ncbi:MAG: 6-phosphogluconolactonase [Chloroflexi bacterium]|nr:6-phosphogluconolactonase [Chloroflexota bacterium]